MCDDTKKCWESRSAAAQAPAPTQKQLLCGTPSPSASRCPTKPLRAKMRVWTAQSSGSPLWTMHAARDATIDRPNERPQTAAWTTSTAPQRPHGHPRGRPSQDTQAHGVSPCSHAAFENAPGACSTGACLPRCQRATHPWPAHLVLSLDVVVAATLQGILNKGVGTSMRLLAGQQPLTVGAEALPSVYPPRRRAARSVPHKRQQVSHCSVRVGPAALAGTFLLCFVRAGISCAVVTPASPHAALCVCVCVCVCVCAPLQSRMHQPSTAIRCTGSHTRH